MKWTHIVIHHSLTKDGTSISWQAIRKYHIETNGWRDIGYHFGVELVNSEYEVLVGRNLDQEGAHCMGMNSKGIGICFVGNFDTIEVPEAAWKKGAKFVKSLMVEFGIPIENIVPHRDYAPKSCPGKLFDMEKFRKEVLSYG